jgi:hypothetical protein
VNATTKFSTNVVTKFSTMLVTKLAAGNAVTL